ncbi:MAG: extracellular solute-binding protein, partial [Chloroflexota bacterium]|nr:extracellular solute-binding protein [Chloroflexota bacterium]
PPNFFYLDAALGFNIYKIGGGFLPLVVVAYADAGFVYRSDLRDTGLRSLTIPNQNPGDIAYVAAVLNDSPHHDAAQVFLDFLLSDSGQRILASHGFLVSVAATP